jgi:hypothetical protein
LDISKLALGLEKTWFSILKQIKTRHGKVLSSQDLVIKDASSFDATAG